jgi:hypothetical protein
MLLDEVLEDDNLEFLPRNSESGNKTAGSNSRAA